MTLPVKRIKNMDPVAWELFKDLAKAHGLEHADLLKWLVTEQVKREVAAPLLVSPSADRPGHRVTPPETADSGLASDAADGSAEPPINGTV